MKLNTQAIDNQSERMQLPLLMYFISGVGQVAMAATGAIILSGVTIGAVHWAHKTITNNCKCWKMWHKSYILML
ncbi:MAG: hypothetical protein RR494_11325 [Vagococcus sp.]|uniref:hypothetical protein n=1 Tax=Vagococcus sp. TaxID=1933889 RepID=UPI002FCAB44B